MGLPGIPPKTMPWRYVRDQGKKPIAPSHGVEGRPVGRISVSTQVFFQGTYHVIQPESSRIRPQGDAFLPFPEILWAPFKPQPKGVI